jgi:hypothetical protein
MPYCPEKLSSINRLQGLLWNEGLLVVPLNHDSGGPDKVREICRQLEIGFLPVFAHRVATVPDTRQVNSDGGKSAGSMAAWNGRLPRCWNTSVCVRWPTRLRHLLFGPFRIREDSWKASRDGHRITPPPEHYQNR